MATREVTSVVCNPHGTEEVTGAAPVWLGIGGTGLSARAADVRYHDGEMYPQVVVTNPAARVRGSARLCEDDAVLRDCRFAGPGRPGLTPAQVADATAATLAVASTCGSTTPVGWRRG
jgi:hypothetical protein